MSPFKDTRKQQSRQYNKQQRGHLLDITLPLTLIIIWEITTKLGVVNSTLFPSPSSISHAFFSLLISGELLMHVASSMHRVIIGLCMGATIGILIGTLTGRSKSISRLINPTIHMLRSFPPVAIIPLVIVWMGIGETAKVFSISFAVFFPIWINTYTGSKTIPQEYMRSANLLIPPKTMVAKTTHLIYIILPASLPHIIPGIRSGISIAFIMVFVSELAGASSGIGYLISISHLAYRIDNMIVGLCTLGTLGALTDYTFTKTTHKVFPWIQQSS